MIGFVIGITLTVLSIYSLIFLNRDFIYVLIYLEVGILGLLVLFASLAFCYNDIFLQALILVFLCMGAIESIIGIILIILYMKKFKVLTKCI